jgi:hypothetical protein
MCSLENLQTKWKQTSSTAEEFRNLFLVLQHMIKYVPLEIGKSKYPQCYTRKPVPWPQGQFTIYK